MKWKDKAAQANFDSAKLDFEKALTTALNEVNTNYLAYQKRPSRAQQPRAALRLGQEKQPLLPSALPTRQKRAERLAGSAEQRIRFRPKRAEPAV